MKKYTYGFIGMGSMGFAILKGLLKTVPAENITFSSRDREKQADISARTGVEASKDNAACAEASRVLILAVKPQQLAAVADIKNVLCSGGILISILPGVTIEKLQEIFGSRAKIVRAMPNTPALVGEGMCGMACQAELTAEEKALAEAVFCGSGRTEWVEEKLMDAVVCASGSSPAYVYMFIEALADGAVKCGMPRAMAYSFAAQSVLGAAKMVLETGMHPGALKDMVTSPGGTTIAGVEALEEWGFRNAVMKATAACYEKCAGMAGKGEGKK